MTRGAPAPATLPPEGLSGLDPGWSRLVTVPGLDGVGRTWHVLDNQVEQASVTIVAVHGNPTWSYLWRWVIDAAPDNVRVIAVDQLNMGFSERTGTMRRLQQRIDDLGAVIDALDIEGPVVTLAHDWGGPIALGWAVDHVERLAGVILLNTAVHQPPGSPAPTLIRMARAPGVLRQVTQRTPIFLNGTFALSRPAIPSEIRTAYRAPYTSPERRYGIWDFVADIPLDPNDPSFRPLERVAAGLEQLAETPVLLLWGPQDPVFADRYLRDLHHRMPHAVIHRFEGASHLVSEDRPELAEVVHRWIASLAADEPQLASERRRRPVFAALEDRAADESVAVVEMHEGQGRRSTFAELHTDVGRIAAGLAASGIRSGDRVALLVPPGLDLTAVLYACWRLGAVVVIVDAGLGAKGIGRALKSASPVALIGVPRALAAARALRWPGRRVAVGASDRQAAALGAVTLDAIRERGWGGFDGDGPGDAAPAAVAFTSGSTGPAKGVAYRHHQLQAQRDALMELYQVGPDDRLVAAFAPFALYGPAMGIPSVVPDMDVTAPGTLTATALADAVSAVDATLVFASPAALANVVTTRHQLTDRHRRALEGVRIVMSAGAPISPSLLRAIRDVLPNAEPNTPYGMTEALPIANITLDEIDAAGEGWGVCVGHPLAQVEVAILPIDELGRPADRQSTAPEIVGEVCVRAPHMKDQYDKLWATQAASARPPGWHRTGDVGRLDGDGRLWIEGRMAHLILTDRGPVTPVGVEHAAERADGVHQAAAVGVGPIGTQQLVVVVATSPPATKPAPAEDALAARVRASVGLDVASVLVVPELPTDLRHNSKIERTRIAGWADRILAGGRIGRL